MHKILQQYCGVDLPDAFPQKTNPDGTLFGQWRRNDMGICSFPYLSCQESAKLNVQMLGDQLKEIIPLGG